MGTVAVVAVGILAALGGVLYNPVHSIVYTTIGAGRVVQPISDFPYKCRKLTHPDLHACEDIAIDEAGRTAYLACSTPLNRKNWQPAVDRLNSTGRELKDHFAVLNLDSPGSDGNFGVRLLKPLGFAGYDGRGTLDLHGFDIESVGDNSLRFWVVNHRPPVGADGQVLTDTVAAGGANSTIEVFDLKREQLNLIHKYTYFDPLVRTPNRVAATGENGFVVTNDKSVKVGFRREFDLIIGGGDLAHCEHGKCIPAIKTTLSFPNGLTKSHKDGLYYVPSTADGTIRVYAMMPHGMLTEVDVIHVGYPMDNLSVDRDGDIWAAGFPKLFDVLPGFDNPFGSSPPATMLRIRKNADGAGYQVDKIIEDRDGEMLPMTTSVVHDVATGRLFMGSVYAPFTTVCDPLK